MGTDEIFNYVMETPENTNPNVLRSLLNNLDSGTSLPDDPAQDGTYNLQNTVSSGTGTLSWAGGGGGEKFIVTLTPTAADFSGTMDKTVAEINEAYEAGQEIVFRIYASATHYYDLNVTLTDTATSNYYPSFGAYGVLTEKFILFYTGTTGNTYYTNIYALTPAS